MLEISYDVANSIQEILKAFFDGRKKLSIKRYFDYSANRYGSLLPRLETGIRICLRQRFSRYRMRIFV